MRGTKGGGGQPAARDLGWPGSGRKGRKTGEVVGLITQAGRGRRGLLIIDVISIGIIATMLLLFVLALVVSGSAGNGASSSGSGSSS